MNQNQNKSDFEINENTVNVYVRNGQFELPNKFDLNDVDRTVEKVILHGYENPQEFTHFCNAKYE